MLTRAHPSACTAADCIAISTVCTTKLQMRPRLSIEISAHLLEPRRRSRAFSLPLIFHPSFGLSVVLGTLSKAGCRGWTGVKRLLNYGFLSEDGCTRCVQQEKRGAEDFSNLARRSAPLQIVAPASCSGATHEAHLLSVSKFFVSFCLIRNLTMFSLVEKLKQ